LKLSTELVVLYSVMNSFLIKRRIKAVLPENDSPKTKILI